MRENEIFKHLKTLLDNSLDIPNVVITRNYQPTAQGANFSPTIYFSLISQKRYGYLQRNDIPDGDKMRHIEQQLYETTIQFTGYVMEGADTDLRSTDLLNDAAAVLQSDAGRNFLQSKGISLLRVQDIRHTFITADSDNYQSSPSFDFIVRTYQIKESITPIINSTEFNKYRV